MKSVSSPMCLENIEVVSPLRLKNHLIGSSVKPSPALRPLDKMLPMCNLEYINNQPANDVY